MTVFLTTHYLEEADKLAGRLAIIDQGRIVAEGTPNDLKSSIGGDVVTVSVEPVNIGKARDVLRQLDGLRDTRVEGDTLTLFVDDGSGSLAGVIRLLDSASVPVGSLAVSQPSLDEVFLRTTGSRLEGADATEEEAR
jgi:ABC-2 type transport system ATP-binding protein